LENAVSEDAPENVEFKFQTVGEQLRIERERRGLSLADVALKTRVPIRHLQAIDKSEFSALPGSTYTIGFARSYARCLEMDDARIAADLRNELAEQGQQGFVPTPQFEPADPARVPSKLFAWTAAGIGVLVVAGYLLWRSTMVEMPVNQAVGAESAVDASIQTDAAKPSTPANTVDAIDPKGLVVLTAKEEVWVKIYDKQKKRIYENTMKAGDSFTVPADADGPMILTGRPDVLTVSIGGKAVAPLGPPNKTVADLDISAAALTARPAAAPGLTPAQTAPATGTAPAPVNQ
jgi:cytoskeleton protein RodZ